MVVGEWMPVLILYQEEGNFYSSSSKDLKATSGLWNRIVSADFNNDGKIDFAVGNYGLNSQLKEPLSMYYADFDNNGSIDPILCTVENGKEYPFVSKDDLQSQLVELKSKYVSYASYADQSIEDVFGEEQLSKAQKLEAKELASSVVINLGEDRFKFSPLPMLSQTSPVYALIPVDVDHDGITDIITAGNLFGTRVKLGRYNSSRGEFLKGLGDGTFYSLPYSKSGLNSSGQVRDISMITISSETYLLFAKNNESLEAYLIQ